MKVDIKIKISYKSMENENSLLNSLVNDLESLSEYDPTIKKLLSSSQRKLEIANGKMGGGGGKSSSRSSNILSVLFGLLTLLFAIMGTSKSGPMHEIANHAKDTVNKLSELILAKNEIEVTRPFHISLDIGKTKMPMIGTFQRSDEYALLPEKIIKNTLEILEKSCPLYEAAKKSIDTQAIVFELTFREGKIYIDYAEAHMLTDHTDGCLKSSISTFSQYNIDFTKLLLHHIAAFNLHETMIKENITMYVTGQVMRPLGSAKIHVYHKDPTGGLIVLISASKIPIISTSLNIYSFDTGSKSNKYVTNYIMQSNSEMLTRSYRTALSPYSSVLFPNDVHELFNYLPDKLTNAFNSTPGFETSHSIPYDYYPSKLLIPDFSNKRLNQIPMQDNSFNFIKLIKQMFNPSSVFVDKIRKEYGDTAVHTFKLTEKQKEQMHEENKMMDEAIANKQGREAIQMWIAPKLSEKDKKEKSYVELDFKDQPLFRRSIETDKIIVNGLAFKDVSIETELIGALFSGAKEFKDKPEKFDFTPDEYIDFFKETSSGPSGQRKRIEDLKSISIPKKGGRTRTSKKRKGNKKRKGRTRKQPVDLLRKFFKI
jgi:hypothetical protein